MHRQQQQEESVAAAAAAAAAEAAVQPSVWFVLVYILHIRNGACDTDHPEPEAAGSAEEMIEQGSGKQGSQCATFTSTDVSVVSVGQCSS